MKKLLLFFMTFFTLLSYAQFPEGFESATFPPTGWAVFDNGNGTNQWIRNTSLTPHTGVACARINGQNVTDGTTAIDWLVSPAVNVPANGQVRFYGRKTQIANFGSTYSIRVAPATPATNQTDPAAFTTIQTWTETDFDPTIWQQKFVLLTAYIGQDVFIAFVMENDNGDRWLVDDVKVDSQCLAPNTLQATASATSAMLSWTSPNPAGPWEIEYGPAGFTAGATPSQGTIVSVTTNPYNLTGLTALTSYDFYVRTICDVDSPSPWSTVRNFTTTELPPECNGNFVDSGGSSGTYPDNYNNTSSPVVICPATPGDLVTVTFTSFNTEATYDALYVYDGPDTGSPLISSGNTASNVPGGLAGGFWGTTIPGPFTSTHPSGCLTFVFRSDSSVVRDGWTANVTCAPPPDYCGGDHFYDLGGPTGNYPNNLTSTRGYTKICPNAGQSATVFFNSFDVADDSFAIYDGDDITTALLVGTYTGTNIIPSYTASNPTGNGCLIFVLTSNSSTNAAGWDASIVCGPACQAITSTIASSNPAPSADTVIRACQDQVITFNGDATFGTSGTGATYNWNFGDNTTATGQTVTHAYPDPGIYSVNLYAVDANGCRSVNRLNQLVYVSTDPSFAGTIAADDEICLGQSTTITGVVTPVTFSKVCAPPVSGTTFLPDGSGVTYQTSVPVDCFALGSTLTSASQITSVCLNMEHSYLGDLRIKLISPSGESIILKAFTGTGSGGGGTYLGCPNDDPSTVPGIGRVYCFTPTATTFLVNGTTSPCGNPSSASINAGNYMPVDSFNNLIGSTLNGNWSIEIIDNLGIDNGYIFDWSISFDNSLINVDYSFTPTIASSFWSSNSSIVSTSGETITVTPTVLGTNCYTYNVVDNFGCTYSYDVCIETTPGVTMTTNTASPLTVLIGQNGSFNFSGGTPFAVVTYNINGGADQTINLDAAGTAIVNVTALVVDTTLTVTGIAEPLVPTTGNVIVTTGGINPNNSTGPISPVGAAANTTNCTTVSGSSATNSRLELRLADELPAGTVITISIARNTNSGSVNITDGINTITFNAGPNNILQRIPFTLGAATDLITITRNNGNVYVDGIEYTFDKPGCDAPLNLPATIVVTPPPPYITSVSNDTICQGADAIFNIVGSANTTVTYTINGGSTQTILLDVAGEGTITVPNATADVVLLISQIQAGTQIDTTPITRTVVVNPTPTLILSSAGFTSNQTICTNSALVPIQYTFDGGVTNVTVTGLPTGVSYTTNGNIVTISGTPTTTAAVFNYTVTALGSSCGTPILSGSIEVTDGILPIFDQVAPVCQGATINIPTSSLNTPSIVGVWNLVSTTANDVTYQFTPNPNQCGLNTTMTIVVHPLPTVTPSETSQSFCSGGTTNINLVSDVPGSVFYWTATGTSVSGQSGSVTGSGATSINQTLVLDANQVAAGQVTYTIVAEANGCLGNPVTVVVTVNPYPNVIVSPASLTETICSGETTNISFTGAINNTVYTWSVVSSMGVSGAFNGVGSVINQTLTTTGLSQGTVVYEVTPSLNGCTGTPERITVTVNPVPELFGSTSHPDLCSGEPTNISVSTFNAATVFNWIVEPNGVSGASAGTDSGLSINIIQTLTTTGNTRGYVDYIITPVLSGCSGTPIKVRVYVNPLPVATLKDGTICVTADGVPFQSYVLDSGLADADHSFVWTFEGNTIPGATSATYTATEVGTYTVVATNSTTNCVSNVASAIVTATNPAISLIVTQSEYFSDNATIVVTVTGGNGTLLYQLDEGLLQESNVFTGVSGNTHTITVVDTQGCTYLTQEVLVIDFPKYFTPNGDGYHDNWNISGLNQPDAKIYIFDRYGKLIKQIVPSSLGDGWDGTYNNLPLPSSDYWFTLDYTENGTQKQFKAHFSLKR